MTRWLVATVWTRIALLAAGQLLDRANVWKDVGAGARTSSGDSSVARLVQTQVQQIKGSGSKPAGRSGRWTSGRGDGVGPAADLRVPTWQRHHPTGRARAVGVFRSRATASTRLAAWSAVSPLTCTAHRAATWFVAAIANASGLIAAVRMYGTDDTPAAWT